MRGGCDYERKDLEELEDLIFGEGCNDDSDAFDDPSNNKIVLEVVECDSNIDIKDKLNVYDNHSKNKSVELK